MFNCNYNGANPEYDRIADFKPKLCACAELEVKQGHSDRIVQDDQAYQKRCLDQFLLGGPQLPVLLQNARLLNQSQVNIDRYCHRRHS